MQYMYTLIVIIAFFAGLIIILRRMMSKNVMKATAYLQELTADYTQKQKEITTRLEDAKGEAQRIITKAKAESEYVVEKSLKEAAEAKEKMMSEARDKSEQMLEQAERTCEALTKDIDVKIERRARERAIELIGNSLPDNLKKDLHCLWMKELNNIDFQPERLNVSADIKEIKIITALSLKSDEKKMLEKRIKDSIKSDFVLKEEVDAGLIAGFVIYMGDLVMDGSVRHRVQEAVRK